MHETSNRYKGRLLKLEVLAVLRERLGWLLVKCLREVPLNTWGRKDKS